MSITEEQMAEFKKCCSNFSYFCKYLKIRHPTKGITEFKLYDYQLKLIEHYNNNRFTILKKFRDGEFTTTTVLWMLWNCLFKVDQRFIFISPNDDYNKSVKKNIDVVIESLPEMFQPILSKSNAYEIRFADTDANIVFLTPQVSRGKGCDWIIIDEPAFIKDMKNVWNAVYPCISCGGKAIVLSAPNGKKGWFYETYCKAQKGLTNWKIFETDYFKHSDHKGTNWQLRKELGEEGWKQGILAEF